MRDEESFALVELLDTIQREVTAGTGLADYSYKPTCFSLPVTFCRFLRLITNRAKDRRVG